MRTPRTSIILFLLLGITMAFGDLAGAREQTSIVFLTWKPNQPEVWNRLLQRFERSNPDIRVRVQVGPHSSTEYHAIVSQRLKNRDASVDVFFMDVIWPAEFANAGWAMNLSSRFD
ncbi:MAG: extracellular solute-binding protein, partial [Deltaproteobacteria bacterium]|nr:extracellular solute-binding protein [Deltaproteobacteria bacterium]